MSDIGKRLDEALKAAGISQNELARRLKIRQSTISALKTGGSRGSKHILRMARELGQDPEWLDSGKGKMRAVSPGAHGALPTDLHLSMRQVPVIGYVQAGVWLSTVELPPADRFDVPLPVQSAFDGFVVQGLVVRGPSMDEVYPHGTILAVVSFMDLGRDPRNGERVVALRSRHGESEATVKEYRIGRDGKPRLWPRSSHPDFQQPVTVDEPNGEDEELRIAYLVIGSYRPEA